MRFSKTGALASFLAIAEIGFAIAIVVIIAEELWPGTGQYYVCTVDPTTGAETCGYFYSDGSCLLSNNSINVCRYGYSTAAIGIVLSLFTAGAICIPPLATALLAVLGALWWLAYSITVTVYSDSVDNSSFTITAGAQTLDVPFSYPRGNYRTMVIALSWTTFACSALTLPLALAMHKAKAAK